MIKVQVKTKGAKKTIDSIRKELTGKIGNGLDEPLSKSVTKVKEELKSLINDGVRVPIKSSNSIENQLIQQQQQDDFLPINQTVAKSEKDLIQYIFDIDFPDRLNQLNEHNNQTYMGEKVFVGNSYNHIELVIPIQDDENIESQFFKAVNEFKNSIFVLNINGETVFLYNNNLHLEDNIKIECSRRTDIFTKESQRVYDSYKNSKKRTQFTKIGDGRRFAKWSINKHGMNKIINEGLNITDIFKEIQKGNNDLAMDLIKQKIPSRVPIIKQMFDKIKNLTPNQQEPDTSLPENIVSYTNLIQLINGLKFVKSKNNSDTIYKLKSISGNIDDENKSAVYLINKYLALWAAENSKVWARDLKKKINQVLNKYRK